ncbi:MAG: SIR2 family protein [Nitrospirae bacterium]|nr:SIR2 family protein [Nitrospirota bacterium]
MANSNRDIIFFIGAGFSRNAGLPMMSEFGTEAKKDHYGLAKHASADRESGLFRHAAPMLVEAAETFELFQVFMQRAYTLKNIDINNLETVFSIAEVLVESGQRNVYLNGQVYLMNQLVNDIQLWLWKIYQQLPILNLARKTDGELYNRFFELVASAKIAHRITVLSTNYDIVYEYLAWKHEIPCAYPITWDKQFGAGHGSAPYIWQNDSCDDKTIVCKLHGGVNFFEDSSMEDGKLFVASDLGDKNQIGKSGVWEEKPAILAVDAIWNIRKKYGNGFTPTIIPPSYAKLSRRPWLRTLWNTALEALKNAKTIIFIGYSIPDSDGFMRALIHGAMAQKTHDTLPSVYVVDPCEETHKRYKAIFNTSLKGLEPQNLESAIINGLPDILKKLP